MKDKVLGWEVPGGLIMERNTPGVCAVCGTPFEKTRFKCGAVVWRSHTCKSPYCLASVVLDPDLIPTSKWAAVHREITRRKHTWSRETSRLQSLSYKHNAKFTNSTPELVELADTSRVLVELVRLRYDSSLWYIDNEWVGEDERGVLDSYGREQGVWSRNSRVRIALKAIGGRPAITIEAPFTEKPAEVLLRELTQSKELPEHYDYLLVWRCGCPEAHEVRYKTAADVPNSYGYHDACTSCWCAPLEVLLPLSTEKEDLDAGL